FHLGQIQTAAPGLARRQRERRRGDGAATRVVPVPPVARRAPVARRPVREGMAAFPAAELAQPLNVKRLPWEDGGLEYVPMQRPVIRRFRTRCAEICRAG